MEVKPGGSGGPALNWLPPLKCSLSQSDPPSLPHEWQDRVLTNFETTYKQSTSTISWLFVSSFPSCPSLPPRASCPSLPPRASPSSLCGTGNALTLHNESKQVSKSSPPSKPKVASERFNKRGEVLFRELPQGGLSDNQYYTSVSGTLNLSSENRAFIALPDAVASKNMNKNQFIAFTCFAVCFCINKLEKKKKRITLTCLRRTVPSSRCPPARWGQKGRSVGTFSLLSMPPF